MTPAPGVGAPHPSHVLDFPLSPTSQASAADGAQTGWGGPQVLLVLRTHAPGGAAFLAGVQSPLPASFKWVAELSSLQWKDLGPQLLEAAACQMTICRRISLTSRPFAPGLTWSGQAHPNNLPLDRCGPFSGGGLTAWTARVHEGPQGSLVSPLSPARLFQGSWILAGWLGAPKQRGLPICPSPGSPS